MVRIAKKSVYLLEFYDSCVVSKYTDDGWVHDYLNYCKKYSAIIIPIPDEFQKKGRWLKYAKLIKIEK
mgnify:CR=1 FL=1|jgi:hypothetical protein